LFRIAGALEMPLKGGFPVSLFGGTGFLF